MIAEMILTDLGLLLGFEPRRWSITPAATSSQEMSLLQETLVDQVGLEPTMPKAPGYSRVS